MIDETKLQELLRVKDGRLFHSEGQELEFKEQFNLAGLADYFRDFAAFANNRGGLLVFGVQDVFLYGYTTDDILLYVGETGKSIKTRLTGDGSGSHNNKEWYREVAYIKYYRASNNNFSAPERKILEETFSLIKEPLHYGKS